jgi:hypothetical protein
MKHLFIQSKRVIIFFFMLLCGVSAIAQTVVDESGLYKAVRFDDRGGGFFLGMSIADDSTKYLQSDVVAPYRLNKPTSANRDPRKWVFTGDKFWPEIATDKVGSKAAGLGGSSGLAVQKTNSRVVYAFFGSSANGDVDQTAGLYKSTDGGENWTLQIQTFADGNEGTIKKNHSTIAIDVATPQVWVYAATQKRGLWRTKSGFISTTVTGPSNWEQIVPERKSFNLDDNGGNKTLSGTIVAVEPNNDDVVTGANPRNKNVYYGVIGRGIFRSTQGGDKGTFALVDSTSAFFPRRPLSITFDKAFNVYVTNAANDFEPYSVVRLNKINGRWENLTPGANTNYSLERRSDITALAVDSRSPTGTHKLVIITRTKNEDLIYRNTISSTGVLGTWELKFVKQKEDMTLTPFFTDAANGGFDRGLLATTSDAVFDVQPPSSSTPRALYAMDAFSVWRTPNVFANPIVWENFAEGVSNAIPFTMISPPDYMKLNSTNPEGPPTIIPRNSIVYVGGSDGNNYRYNTLGDKPAGALTGNYSETITFRNKTNTGDGNIKGAFFGQYMTGIDYCHKFPRVKWEAVDRFANNPAGYVLRSDFTDSVQTTADITTRTRFRASMPYEKVNTAGAKIVASTMNPLNAVYFPGNSAKTSTDLFGLIPKYTIDGGDTWLNTEGLPSGSLIQTYEYDFDHPAACDKVTGKYYCYVQGSIPGFYQSDVNGKVWTKMTATVGAGTLPNRASQPSWEPIRMATPSKVPTDKQIVWIALGSNGLFKTENAGVSFTKVSFFSDARVVDFGTPESSTSANDAIYVHGRAAGSITLTRSPSTPSSISNTIIPSSTSNVAGQWGVFLSQDGGTTWKLITDRAKPLLGSVMAADRKRFGQVFVASQASGVIAITKTGTPTGRLAAETSPNAPSDLNGKATKSEVALSWKDNADNESTFEILRKGDKDSEFTSIATLGYDATGYKDVTPQPGINYSYQVKAVNVNGEGVSSTIDIASATKLPTAPKFSIANSTDYEVNQGENVAYPNPTNGNKITLTLSGPTDNVEVNCFSDQGVPVATELLKLGNNTAELLFKQDLQSGSYILKIKTIDTKKIIVEK